jgi:hypothetical protein
VSNDGCAPENGGNKSAKGWGELGKPGGVDQFLNGRIICLGIEIHDAAKSILQLLPLALGVLNESKGFWI